MKKIILLMTVFSIILITSCNEDEEIETVQYQMTLVTQNANVKIRIAGFGTITIDWGDKSAIETYTLYGSTAGMQNFSHDYSGSSSHTITVSGNDITDFYCNSQGISHLDITNNPVLTYISCGWNQLQQLDVSKNIALLALNCNNNELMSIDVSKNPILIQLYCQGNKITKLDLNRNYYLAYLSCQYNNLSAEALNAMFQTLHNFMFSGNLSTKRAIIAENPGTDNCNTSIAEKKGWSVISTIP